jgi:hypothetical protein
MKRKSLLLSIILLLAACSSKAPEKSTSHSEHENLLAENYVISRVSTQHSKIAGIKGNLLSFSHYLDQLSSEEVTSIALAMNYLKTCIPEKEPMGDSIFRLFNIKFYEIADHFSYSIDTMYKSLVVQLDLHPESREVKIFKDNLHACGLDLLMSEGAYYVDATPEYFYNNFRNRVSDALRDYLDIRKDEMKEGFTEDAELLISFNDVYKRVKRWEQFLAKYPSGPVNSIAEYYYSMYLSTLLTGTDNSNAFDYNTFILEPEMKLLYEHIMKEDPDSRTTKVVTAFYSLMEKHNFRDNESIRAFLDKNNLLNLQGVQPELR